MLNFFHRPRPRLQDLLRGPGPPATAPVLLARAAMPRCRPRCRRHGHGSSWRCFRCRRRQRERNFLRRISTDGKRVKRRERFKGYDVCDNKCDNKSNGVLLRSYCTRLNQSPTALQILQNWLNSMSGVEKARGTGASTQPSHVFLQFIYFPSC